MVGKWHLGSTPGGPAGQLYNLETNSAELDNRWAAEPAIVHRLEALLRAAQPAPAQSSTL